VGGNLAYIIAACSTSSPSCTPPGRVHVLDTTTNTVIDTIDVGAIPVHIVVNPLLPRAYVVNNGSHTLSIVDTSINTTIASVPVAAFPGSVAVHPDGTRAYVARPGGMIGLVSVIDTASNSFAREFHVGGGAFGVAMHPSGQWLYVTHSCEGGQCTTGGAVDVVDTATETVVATVPVGAYPRGIGVHPDGTRIYVANWGNATGDSVSVINAATNLVEGTIDAGPAPFSLSVHPDGTKLYVVTNGDFAVSVIDLTGGFAGGSVMGTGATLARGSFMAPFTIPAGCGNGASDPGEACDDGNLFDGDGCDRNCTTTACGNRVVSAAEECDDGNVLDGDDCSATCELVGCGDRSVTVGEQCDDGNASADDGCDDSCGLELFPGGGSTATDCYVEWAVGNATNDPAYDKTGRHPRKQRCIDGDPGCDRDGTVDGSCTLELHVCANVTDAALAVCTPVALASSEIKRPSESEALRSPEADAARSALGILDTLIGGGPLACSETISVVVPRRPSPSGALKRGRMTIKTVATATSGARDTDAISLVCGP
jgi:YVTN family beta-propeller protein/cysteine-rich repeat protein